MFHLIRCVSLISAMLLAVAAMDCHAVAQSDGQNTSQAEQTQTKSSAAAANNSAAPNSSNDAEEESPKASTKPMVRPSSPEAIQWLDKIDAAGKKLKTMQSQIRYEVIQGAMGDKQIRVGSLYYDAAKPAKFAIHFERLLAGRRLLKEDRWYIFDGRFRVEKIGDQKQFIKRDMIDPKTLDDASAKTSEQTDINPLADGKGPLALPITLSKEPVLKKYFVEIIPAKPDDATDSIHLRLTPYVQQRGDFTEIDLWYGKDSLLPIKAHTLDENENETTVILSKTEVDKNIDAKVFDTTPPAAAEGWTVELKAFGE